MGYRTKDELFLFAVVSIIFCSIPLGARFTFWGLGSVMADKLSLYPLLFGFFLSIFKFRKNGFFADRKDYLLALYLVIYAIVILTSLIHGLLTYPYMQDILNGPGGLGQIEKLPGVYAFLHRNNVPITDIALFKTWLAARTIKSFLLEMFWTFGVAWMVYCWYKNRWMQGFSIMKKGALVSIGIVLLYSILDAFYLSGSWGAASVLKITNPIVHGIKNYGYWWPPLLWVGQLRSVFPEPSYFGIFSAFALPWLWYIFCTVTQRKRQIGLAVIFGAYVMCLFFTKARTANALLFGELILFGLLSLFFRKELLKKYLALMMCVVCAFFISNFAMAHYMPGSPEKAQAMMETKKKQDITKSESLKKAQPSANERKTQNDTMGKYISDNLGSLANMNKRSNRARYSVIAADISIGLDHPLLGVGRSLRQAYIPDHLPQYAFTDKEVKGWINRQKERGVLKAGFPPMGEYSVRFGETGIVGLLVYMLPVIVLLRKSIMNILDKSLLSGERIRFGFWLLSFMGILASGIGDNLNITYAFWLMLGLGYAMCFGEKGSIEPMNHG
jgi:hypothetical protein